MADTMAPEDKNFLREQGTWKQFLARRTELIATGMGMDERYSTLEKEFGVSGRLQNDPQRVTLEQRLAASAEIAAKAAKADATKARAGKGPAAHVATLTPISQADAAILKAKGNDDDARLILSWVFNNIAVTGVVAADAPSTGAWALLETVRASPELLVDFYKVIWPKLLPSKAELEQAEPLSDDGHTIELIDKIAADMRLEAAKNASI